MRNESEGTLYFEVKSEEVVAHFRRLQGRAKEALERTATEESRNTMEALERSAKRDYLEREIKRLAFLAEHVPVGTYRLSQYEAVRFAEDDNVFAGDALMPVAKALPRY